MGVHFTHRPQEIQITPQRRDGCICNIYPGSHKRHKQKSHSYWQSTAYCLKSPFLFQEMYKPNIEKSVCGLFLGIFSMLLGPTEAHLVKSYL